MQSGTRRTRLLCQERSSGTGLPSVLVQRIAYVESVLVLCMAGGSEPLDNRLSPAKHDVEAGEDQIFLLWQRFSAALGEDRLVEGDHLT